MNDDQGAIAVALSILYSHSTDGVLPRVWTNRSGVKSELFGHASWEEPPASHFPILRKVYGSSSGGTLLGGALKMATLGNERVFSHYSIEELAEVPAVVEARALDPMVIYFMDAANVWFYGIKGDNLYSYDTDTGELDDEGAIGDALIDILRQWDDCSAPAKSDDEETPK